MTMNRFTVMLAVDVEVPEIFNEDEVQSELSARLLGEPSGSVSKYTTIEDVRLLHYAKTDEEVDL